MKKMSLFIIVSVLVSVFLYSQTPDPLPTPVVVCPCATLPGSQWYNDVHGVVRNPANGIPISGASVSYAGGSVTTNVAGYYRFTAGTVPCSADIRIIVAAPGYITKDITGYISGCGYNLKNFELEPSDVQPTPVPATDYSITGSVNISSDVRIRLTGVSSAETVTSGGKYSFSQLVPGGSYTITPLADTPLPPKVTITNPAANGNISGIVTVSASIVTDTIGRIWSPATRSISALYGNLVNENFYQAYAGSSISIDNITFFIDGIEKQKYSGTQFTWDTRLFYNGAHTLKVTALDSQGNTGSHEINVYVDNSSPTNDPYVGHIVPSENPIDFGLLSAGTSMVKTLSFRNLNKNETISIDEISFMKKPVMTFGTYFGLYTGVTYKRPFPLPVSDVQSITSNTSVFVIKNDGSLWGWGNNASGSMGVGHTQVVKDPVRIFDGNIAKVAAGASHTLFLKTDGSLWACGRNYEGQLGDGTTVNKTTPVQVLSSGVRDITASSSQSIIIKTDGTLWGFGSDYSRVPTQIDLSDVKKVACGSAHSLALKNDGSLWACGNNNRGQVGDGTFDEKYSFVEIVNSGVADIECGLDFSFFIGTDGSLWGFGYNKYGQIGLRTTNETQPVPIKSISSGVRSVSAGQYHSLIIGNDGSLWSCGQNDYYCLGTGDNVSSFTPVKIFDSGISMAAAGVNHSVCMRSVPVSIEHNVTLPLRINPDSEQSFALTFSSINGGIHGSYMKVVKEGGEVLLNIPVLADAQGGAPFLQGDVNTDGIVNIIDALLTAQYYVGLAPANFDPGAADVNCDGSVNIIDALRICQYYVGLITGFC